MLRGNLYAEESPHAAFQYEGSVGAHYFLWFIPYLAAGMFFRISSR